MDLDEITYGKRDGVGEITLCRPAQLNPISGRPGGTRDQILWALSEAEADPDVGCVLLTGAGKAFSAGGDLTGNKPRESAFEQQEFVDSAEAFLRRLRDARLPVVAAVNGICLGAAVGMVCCCDLVLAGESARFGLPEGRIGLVGAGPLVPLVGRQWAKFLILSGELIDARRARDIGLVLTVEPDDRLLERARELCRRLARLPREAVLLNKRHVDATADASGDAAGRLAGAAHDALTLSNSGRAVAPDGRTFREIIAAEGTAGLKSARAAQYESPWLE
ncbi:MAG TPA: enoyl-CoA hydratase/isomerase family protein [Acidimicrobiales bacterium]|nr:enoyl-CoA hydratase/isomerase family protein [Acidimicrobiales bacterium]